MSIKEYAPHPYAGIFPFRADQSLVELSDSMAKGQKEEIVLLDRMVLDGRRRQAAAIRAGVKPRYRQFGSRPGDGDDPLEFVFAVNFHRRDLSEAERAIAAVNFSTMKRGDNQHTGKGEDGPNGPTSQKEAAKKFNVNPRKVKRAKKVIENGTPELQEAMRTEKVSVSDAAAIAGEKPEVQRKALADVEAGKVKTLQEAVKGKDSSKELVKIGADLDKLIERLAQVDTPKAPARDLACEGLRKARAIIAKL